jgi:broad specificity phosphatase PhoE
MNNGTVHEEDTPYPDGENGSMGVGTLQTRIADIIGQNPERAAVVCHGGTIRVIICGMLGLSDAETLFHRQSAFKPAR